MTIRSRACRRHHRCLQTAGVPCVVFVALLLSCDANDARPTPDGNGQTEWRTFESKHFVYRSRPGDAEVCGATTQALERRFEALEAFVPGGAPRERKIDYFKYENHVDLLRHDVCRSTNDACFVPERGLHTTRPLDLHELVHAYLTPFATSHPLLEEGLAESLSCEGEEPKRPPDVQLSAAVDRAPWLNAERSVRDRLYGAAAWFVGDLLRHKGQSTFFELYRRAHRDIDGEALDKLYRELYDEPLSQAWQRALFDESMKSPCLRVFECASEETAEGNADAFGQGCEQTASRTFTLEQPALLVEETVGQGLTTGSCQDAPATQTLPSLQRELSWRALPRGNYFVSRGLRSTASMISIEALDEHWGPGERCENLEPLVAEFVHEFSIAFTPGVLLPGQDWVMKLRDTDKSRFHDYKVACEGGPVFFCRSCDPGSCEQVCDSDVTVAPRILGDEDLVLRGVEQPQAGLRIDVTRQH